MHNSYFILKFEVVYEKKKLRSQYIFLKIVENQICLVSDFFRLLASSQLHLNKKEQK